MIRALAALLALAACADESITAYAPDQTVWHLSEINGKPVAQDITLTLHRGEVRGLGPCNSYSAKQTAPAPWFQAGPIVSTKRACPALALEQDYFKALALSRLAEASDSVLILSGEDGTPILVFSAPRRAQ